MLKNSIALNSIIIKLDSSILYKLKYENPDVHKDAMEPPAMIIIDFNLLSINSQRLH